MSAAERAIGKGGEGEGERRDTLLEEEEEYDPFDTKGYGEDEKAVEDGEDDIDDPFAVPDAVNEIAEQVDKTPLTTMNCFRLYTVHTVSRPLVYIGLVIAFLCVATCINYLPGLHGNCSSAHQPEGTCKKTVTKPT